jgi:hypothetical protein
MFDHAFMTARTQFREDLLRSCAEGPFVLLNRTGIALATRASALWRS